MLKLDNHTNLNMQNSKVLFTSFTENTFMQIFGPKSRNCQFKVKFGTFSNSNMRYSTVMFTYFVLDQKYPFWANFVQEINTVS